MIEKVFGFIFQLWGFSIMLSAVWLVLYGIGYAIASLVRKGAHNGR